MKRRILLVEDNPDDVTLTLAALRGQGVGAEVVVVEDGVDALEYLERRGKHAGRKPGAPALVLLDLNLPRLGGLELLERLRAHPEILHLPIVVLTSSVEERDIEQAYAGGANSYVRKPVDFDDFGRVVRHLSEYWLDVNEGPPRRMGR
jgi:CheY-like chemotaxis protein